MSSGASVVLVSEHGLTTLDLACSLLDLALVLLLPCWRDHFLEIVAWIDFSTGVEESHCLFALSSGVDGFLGESSPSWMDGPLAFVCRVLCFLVRPRGVLAAECAGSVSFDDVILRFLMLFCNVACLWVACARCRLATFFCLCKSSVASNFAQSWSIKR